MRLSQLFLLISALMFGTVVLGISAGCRLNIEPSVNPGLYHLASVHAPLNHGDLVTLPVPVSMQYWHTSTTPLLKPVVAVAGGVVCVADEGLWVQGIFYGPVLTEAGGRTLPHPLGKGCTVVPDGSVFLASTADRSLDGRYIGFTRVEDLTATASALWVWR